MPTPPLPPLQTMNMVRSKQSPTLFKQAGGFQVCLDCCPEATAAGSSGTDYLQINPIGDFGVVLHIIEPTELNAAR